MSSLHDQLVASLVTGIALLKFCKKQSVLPDPEGPLSSGVPSTSIAAANKAVKPLCKVDIVII